VAGYRPFHPSLLGKTATAAQVATLWLAVCHRARVPYMTTEVVTFFVYLTAALTLASAVHYVLVLRTRYGRRENGESAESGG